MRSAEDRHRRRASLVLTAMATALTMAIVASAFAAPSGRIVRDNLTAARPASALAASSGVLAWGNNREGQLGDGMTTGPEACEGDYGPKEPCSRIPVAVTGLSGVTSVAAGGERGTNEHSLALLKNGTVMAWGYNGSGQLGNGTTTESDEPVAVSGPSGVKAIAAGSEHSLALLKNGTVMAWGDNGSGELGNGTTTESDVPVAVSGLSGVTAIAAGGFHSLAVSAQPVVTEVEPNSGLFTGGTRVSIAGINFTRATAVRFGSANAVRFRVTSATSITAVSPPGTGTVDVTVTNSTGTSRTGIDDRFSYAPTVAAVTPSNGPAAETTSLTITGTNFTRATAVRFGSANAVRFRVTSANSIAAVAPAGTGTVNVTVTTPGGTSAISTADLFSYTTRGEWLIFPTPNLGAVGSGLNGVSCVSQSFCIAVGYKSRPGWQAEALIERWNGTVWSTVSAPTTGELRGVSCTSAKFCVAVGSYEQEGSPDSSGPRSVIDTWDGTTWSSTAAAPSNGKFSLTAVSCVSPSFCIAVGGGIGGGPPRTLVLSWNGVTWSHVDSPNAGYYAPNELRGVSCASSTFCMAVGKYTDGALIESWNGVEWSVEPVARRGAGENALYSVSCVSAEHCVAVGAAEGSLVESWSGGTWSILESPSPEGSTLNGVSCVSVASCVAVGVDTGPTGTQTLVEALKGSGWSIVPSADGASSPTELEGVSRASAESWFAVGKYEATAEGPFQTLVETGEI